MTWIVLEGLDRTFKSSVAELYRDKGYDVVHFSAPAKKYTAQGYAGPSYLEDVLTLLVSLSGKDVVFDRSWYGESSVWPQVYGRNPLLSAEDIEMIREIEDQNQPTRILMHDPDMRAHWQRCLDNKEPLDGVQFKTARELFYKMAEQHGFTLKTKDDFMSIEERQASDQLRYEQTILPPTREQSVTTAIQIESTPRDTESLEGGVYMDSLTPEQKRLAEANAINDVLSKPIVKLKGEHYTNIEAKIRSFLNQELATLLGTSQPVQANSLTDEEIKIFRALIKRSPK